MAKYDYLIVGAGLYGSTFAYCAKQQGKKCLVIDKRPHLGATFIVRESQTSTSTNMDRTFSILLIRKYGISLTPSWSSTGLQSLLSPSIKGKHTICLST